MILRRNINDWSCLPTAFAMAIDVSPEWLVQEIGHSGDDEPYGYPGLKAGFHEQECIEVLLRHGYACTPIEVGPTISPNLDKQKIRRIYFGGGLGGNWARLLRHMAGTCGVLTGTHMKSKTAWPRGHAVAWDGEVIHDSIGPRCYPFEDAVKYGFTPGCFWKVQYVKVHG